MINLVAGVVTGEGRDGRADVADGEGCGVVYVCGVAEVGVWVEGGEVIVVEELDLVFMGVAEENASDGGGGEAANDGVEEGLGSA